MWTLDGFITKFLKVFEMFSHRVFNQSVLYIPEQHSCTLTLFGFKKFSKAISLVFKIKQFLSNILKLVISKEVLIIFVLTETPPY